MLLGASALTGAVLAGLAPLFALLLLMPIDYGLFSIVYLVYAFGISLHYSVVSETWARQRLAGTEASWASYSRSMLELGVLAGGVSFVIGLAIPELRDAAPFLAGAALLALYQNGARYFRVADGSYRRVVASDCLGIVAFGAAIVATQGLAPLLTVSVAWCAAAFASTAVLGVARPLPGDGLVGWVRKHHRTMRPLLSDSLLMDAGSIGTPFLLAGLLGPARFGIYRAVANVALPVRLVIEPLRPAISGLGARTLFTTRWTLTILLSAAALAAAYYLALVVVLPVTSLEIGTLTALVPHAAATSVFVASNLIGTVYYFACRTGATHRQLMTGRIIQTGLVVVLPIMGYLVWGLDGAIWGFAVSALVSALSWAVVARVLPIPS